MASRIKRVTARAPGSLLIALSFIAGVGSATATDAACPRLPPLFPSAHVSTLQIRNLVTNLVVRDGLQCKEFAPHQIQCDSRALPEVWIFVQPGHPAYPAVSRGIIVRSGTLTCILRDGYFAGSESAFRAWMAKLTGYDKRIIEKVRHES